MDTIVINISWEYFLGVMGALIAIAYYANGRFTALETDIDWLKEMISELSIKAENVKREIVQERLSCYRSRRRVITPCAQRTKVVHRCQQANTACGSKRRNSSDPYEVQRRAFRFLAELSFDEPVARHLNNFAFCKRRQHEHASQGRGDLPARHAPLYKLMIMWICAIPRAGVLLAEVAEPLLFIDKYVD